MGLWSGIKYALNSTLGTDKFMPLDRTVMKEGKATFDALYEQAYEGYTQSVINSEITSYQGWHKVASFTLDYAPHGNVVVSATMRLNANNVNYYVELIVQESTASAPTDSSTKTMRRNYASTYQTTSVTMELQANTSYDVYLNSNYWNYTAYINDFRLSYEIPSVYPNQYTIRKSGIKRTIYGSWATPTDAYGSFSNPSADLSLGVAPNKSFVILNGGSDGFYAYPLSTGNIRIGFNGGGSSPISCTYQVVEFY